LSNSMDKSTIDVARCVSLVARLGVHPYRAGPGDCAAATEWVGNHKADLSASNVVVSGESGGRNLALAVALKAKKDRWAGVLDASTRWPR
jgi:acetyl esterase/lipase